MTGIGPISPHVNARLRGDGAVVLTTTLTTDGKPREVVLGPAVVDAIVALARARQTLADEEGRGGTSTVDRPKREPCVCGGPYLSQGDARRCACCGGRPPEPSGGTVLVSA